MKQPPIQSTPAGALRFNTDSSKLEYYDGNQWVNITSTSPDVQTGGTRALAAGGATPTTLSLIEYANIDSTGVFADFGNLGAARNEAKACGSRTRGIISGGYYDGSDRNDIYYVTFASTGETANNSNESAGTVGNLSANVSEHAALSNSTRGIFAGGKPAERNIIDYITIASTGNAKNFGELSYSDATGSMGAASPTRGIVAGGSPSPITDAIDYITISTLGNGSDFGNLTDSRYSGGSASNAVRAVFGGGWSPSHTNIIDYITMATLGDAKDFGDLSVSRYLPGGAASPIRAVFMGGHRNPSPMTSTVDYVQIMTTANAVDFGDLQAAKASVAGCSNGHGGLG